MIFVFGSNLAGRHGKGAALFAKRKKGAKPGIGVGLQGDSYAIPTKDWDLKPLSLSEINDYVQQFLDFARKYPHLEFEVTPIGTGLAGYSVSQIAPMFQSAPENCWFTDTWNKE